jgi:putative sterol carrier protein
MPVKIFFCYAHEDEALLNKLKTHLRPLQRMGLIDVWHDRDISAGTKWEEEIDKHLSEANIILLLVSPDFMDSDYCYGKEMQRALERHQWGEACVIPIILRPVYWQGVLGTLQALPKNAKPIISSSWYSPDDAFFDVAEGIRKVVTEFSKRPEPQISQPSTVTSNSTRAYEIETVQPAQPIRKNTFTTRTDETFRIMSTKFKSEAAAGMNKTFEWNITGTEEGRYALKIADSKCELITGGVDKPDVTFTVSDQDWFKICEGKLDQQSAFFSGQLKIAGDMGLALKFPQIFPIKAIPNAS